MKSLHKKISAVALIAVLGAPVLSQGLVISSNSSSSSSIKKGLQLPYDELQNYLEVIRYEQKYNYEALYLNIYYIPKQVDLQYPDRWAFVKGLQSGHLDKYRKERESIVIKVGKSYFRIYFPMSQHQRDRIIVKECAKNYKFDIVLVNRSDSSVGLVEMGAKIRSYFKGQPKLIEKLLKEPSEKWVDVFPDGESFRSSLELRYIKIPQGYSRYRIGDSDYIFLKK